MPAQEPPRFPETAPGKLVEGFFRAVNAADDGALASFQEANYSDAALRRRSKEERLEWNRQLREQTGSLTLTGVESASPVELVVTATGSAAPGVPIRIRFQFTGGSRPKIEALQITG